jgi:3-dehydroquinate synthetase
MSQDTQKQKIDVDRIDLEKERENTTDQPGLIAFPHTVGGAVIKPEDQGKMKGRAVSAMRQQTDRQMRQLYEQAQTLARQAQAIKDRVDISERIYEAEMNFEPIIAHTYFLYQKKDETDVLSLVSPEEWGRSYPFKAYVAKVTLLSDHTWEVEPNPENQ